MTKSKAKEVKTPEIKKKPAKPVRYTKELGDEICERLMSEETLRKICLDEHMPERKSIFRWLADSDSKYDAFRHQYELAYQVLMHMMAEDTFEIVDNGENDWMRINKGEKESWVVNGEAIQRSRLRTDWRKWILSKRMPKVYGDRINEDDNKNKTFNLVITKEEAEKL